jgi:hypothetical protein
MVFYPAMEEIVVGKHKISEINKNSLSLFKDMRYKTYRH